MLARQVISLAMGYRTALLSRPKNSQPENQSLKMTKITSRKIQQIIKLYNTSEAKIQCQRTQINLWKGEFTKQLLIIAYKYGAVAHMQVWRPPIFIWNIKFLWDKNRQLAKFDKKSQCSFYFSGILLHILGGQTFMIPTALILLN